MESEKKHEESHRKKTILMADAWESLKSQGHSEVVVKLFLSHIANASEELLEDPKHTLKKLKKKQLNA